MIPIKNLFLFYAFLFISPTVGVNITQMIGLESGKRFLNLKYLNLLEDSYKHTVSITVTIF